MCRFLLFIMSDISLKIQFQLITISFLIDWANITVSVSARLSDFWSQIRHFLCGIHQTTDATAT